MLNSAKSILIIFALIVSTLCCIADEEVLLENLTEDTLFLAGYNFASDTLNNALPDAPDGTNVHIWTGTTWGSTSVKISGSWTPNNTLTNGTAFFIEVFEDTDITIHGTEVTSTVNRTIYKGSSTFNAIANPHFHNGGGGYEGFERIEPPCSPYQSAHICFPCNTGDIVMMWNYAEQEYDQWERTFIGGYIYWHRNGIAPGDADSPKVWPGRGVLFNRDGSGTFTYTKTYSCGRSPASINCGPF